MLKTASDHGLHINFKKCQFIKKSIEFLGRVIEGGKIYLSPEKIKAVVDYPEPQGLLTQKPVTKNISCAT